MSRAERDKWDERYRAGSYRGRTHPTTLLAEWAPRLPRGRALDVACGAGRNALFLAAAGYRVDALDISTAALERGRNAAATRRLHVHWIETDLDVDPDSALPDARYDLIVWVRYVNAELTAAVLRRLSDGGCLLCEQHLATAADVVGPKDPAFRLQGREILQAAAGLRVLHHYEGPVVDPDGRAAALAQLVACRDI